MRALARQVGLEFVDLADCPIDRRAVALARRESLARRYQAIPIGWEDGKLVVAMADPSNVFAVDDIRAITGAEVQTVVATAARSSETIDRFYRLDAEVDAVAQAAPDELAETTTPTLSLAEVVEDAPIVKFVNLLDHARR